MSQCSACAPSGCDCIPATEPLESVASRLYRTLPGWQWSTWTAHGATRAHVGGMLGGFSLDVWHEDGWRAHARPSDELASDQSFGPSPDPVAVAREAAAWCFPSSGGAVTPPVAAVESADVSRRGEARSGDGTGHRAAPPVTAGVEDGDPGYILATPTASRLTEAGTTAGEVERGMGHVLGESLESVAERLNREVPLPGGARWRHAGLNVVAEAGDHRLKLWRDGERWGAMAWTDGSDAATGPFRRPYASTAALDLRGWVEGQRTIQPDFMVGTPDADLINRPAHYGGPADPYEAIKVIEAWGLGFHLGNVVKYVSRAERKGAPVEDLKKARWYLDREIGRREEKANA